MTATTDVVVVGAGILGAATARQLAGAGMEVTVLEATTANAHGSGATAGNVHVQGIHTRRPGQHTPVDVRRLLPLQRAAFEGWQAWQQELGPELGYRKSGSLMVAETADEVAELHRKLEWERTAGIPTEIVDGDVVRGKEPAIAAAVQAATWCEWDGYADPAMATPALIGDAVVRGVDVREHSPVIGLSRSGDGWAVRTATGIYSCRYVVDVAGPWLADVSALAGCRLRLTPTAIQIFFTRPLAPVVGTLIQHVAQGMSIKQMASGQLMVGGGWPAGPMRPDGSADVDPAGVRGSVAQAGGILPVICDVGADRAWAGPLAATPDEMPVVGEVPGFPGLFVAGGTYSFTFAPVWAATIAGLINGTPIPVAVDDLSPARLLEHNQTGIDVVGADSGKW